MSRRRWVAEDTPHRATVLVDHAGPAGAWAAEHLWVLMACYALTPAEARACHQGGATGIAVGADKLVAMEGPGCLVCAQLYGTGAERLPCPGEPSWA